MGEEDLKRDKRKKWIWCHPARETDWWICFAIDALLSIIFSIPHSSSTKCIMNVTQHYQFIFLYYLLYFRFCSFDIALLEFSEVKLSDESSPIKVEITKNIFIKKLLLVLLQNIERSIEQIAIVYYTCCHIAHYEIWNIYCSTKNELSITRCYLRVS